MINTLKKGHYELVETRGQTKILNLDKRTYAWISAAQIGELLVSSHKNHKTDHVLAKGRYCLYDVIDEPEYTDLLHVELQTGTEGWQGYLLPTGLPTEHKKRSRIIPTTEIISRI